MKNTAGQPKLDYLWNTAAGLINAAEAVVMSMVVTRITGLTDTGMLTIAFAIGNLLMSVGKFGVRNFQVTDTENKFSFSIYLKARILTVLMMVIAMSVYLLYAHRKLEYSQDKIWIILMICMIYAVEAIEDVIWGYYQYRGRLYAGARMFCLRWIGIFVSFAILLQISRSLVTTLICCGLISIIIFLFGIKTSYKYICEERDKKIRPVICREEWQKICNLLKSVLPLFGISFFSFYENNAPKYAIDACLTDAVQACYGFVAMPVFAIGLLNNFVYQPVLVSMAVEWTNGEMAAFRRRIVKQMVIIGGISFVCISGAYIMGIPVLSLLYNTDLRAYKKELMLLLFASVFLAVSGYVSVVLTIMRFQKSLLWPHYVVSFLAVIFLRPMVKRYQTAGAAYGYLFLMFLLCILYGIILVIKLYAARGDKRCR